MARKSEGSEVLMGVEQLLEREVRRKERWLAGCLKQRLCRWGAYLSSAQRCDHGEKAAREERGKDL